MCAQRGFPSFRAQIANTATLARFESSPPPKAQKSIETAKRTEVIECFEVCCVEFLSCSLYASPGEGDTLPGHKKNGIKMELYQNRIAVTVDELTRSDDGEAVLTKTTYDKLASRKRVVVLRRGCFMTPALVEWTTLPERFRTRYMEKYGDPEEQLRKEEGSLVISDEAREYYAAVVLPDGKHLSDGQIEQYTLNASVMERIVHEVEAQKSARMRGGSASPIQWENVFAFSQMLRKEFGHTLAGTESSLRKKYYEFSKSGYECLVSRKNSNECAQKINEEGGRLIIAMRRSQARRYSLADILRRYNECAEENGWAPLKSVSSIKKFLDRPDIQQKWWAAAYGELAAKQKFDRKHRTQMASARDMLWYGDGTRLNLYYKGLDRSGRPAKCTISVYEVIDAYSEMMLGYCICEVENFEAQRKAFRMAVEVAGYRPYEIVTDNQGGQNKAGAKEFMSKICRISRRTAPHNPQSKSIEQVFGRFQSQVLAKHWAFTGQNITAVSRDSRPNLEFIEANAHSLYTFEEMCAAYAECRQQWNDMPHPRTGKSRRETYYASKNPAALPLTDYAAVDLFWRETEAVFTASGIEIQVDKQKYAFEVFTGAGDIDYDFRRENTGRRFIVKYDPDNLTKVWLYIQSSVGMRRVCEALPYATIHRALQEQSPEEQQFIRDTVAANKMMRIRRQMEGYELEVEHGVAPEQHGLRTPKLAGVGRAAIERLSEQYIASQPAPAEDELATTCEPIAIGEAIKVISNQTFDKATIISKY